MLTSRATAFAEALTIVLTSAGATDITIQHGSKHPRLVYRLDGIERYRAFPGTPSDSVNGVAKAVAELKRELGLKSPVKRVGARRRRRASAPAVPDAQSVLPLTQLPDWRDDLSRHPDVQRHAAYRLHQAWLAFWRSCMRGAGRESLL